MIPASNGISFRRVYAKAIDVDGARKGVENILFLRFLLILTAKNRKIVGKDKIFNQIF